MTLGDDEARRRRTQKTVLERRQPPTFDVVIEIETRDRFAVHHDVAQFVDAILRGRPGTPEIRERGESGDVTIQPAARPRASAEAMDPPRALRIFPYAISEERLERAILSTRVPASVARTPRDANLILTLRTYSKRQPPKLRDALAHDLPVHMLRNSSAAQIEDFLLETASRHGLAEAPAERPRGEENLEAAVRAVVERGESVELRPQPAATRRQQHAFAERCGIGSISRGREPHRRVVLIPAESR